MNLQTSCGIYDSKTGIQVCREVEEVTRGEVVPGAVVPIVEVEVTAVLRTTTVAAATTDGTAPAIGTVEAEAMAIPGRPATIPDGTPGKTIARVVATSETNRTR